MNEVKLALHKLYCDLHVQQQKKNATCFSDMKTTTCFLYSSVEFMKCQSFYDGTPDPCLCTSLDRDDDEDDINDG